MKTTDFDPNKKYTFVVPMGATEQHGPFIPLGTDSYCQDAILDLAKKECAEAIFLPTLEITSSDEHDGFLGTIWLSKETMYNIFKDIVSSVQDYAEHIIFTSWHGGNLGSIENFIKNEQANFPHIAFHHVSPESDETNKKTEEIINGIVEDHAGNTEISMMLAIDDSLVLIPPSDYPKKHINIDWSVPKPVKCVSEDGILDNHPKWVIDKKHGEIFIQLSAEHLRNEIQKIMKNSSK